MNKLLSHTALAVLLAASFSLAHAARGGSEPLAAQAVVSSDRKIPGQDMSTHRAERRDRMQPAETARMPGTARLADPRTVERTGPNAPGSAGSGKTP